jgi:hypothetical protein
MSYALTNALPDRWEILLELILSQVVIVLDGHDICVIESDRRPLSLTLLPPLCIYFENAAVLLLMHRRLRIV